MARGGRRRTPEARRAERRLLLFACAALFVPLLGVLGWLGARQVGALRQALAARAADDLEARGREAAEDLAARIAAGGAHGAADAPALLAAIREGRRDALLLDGAGRLVAPGLPPAEGAAERLGRDELEALGAGRTLEFTWDDPEAARHHYRAVLAGSPALPVQVRALLELLGTSRSLGDWEGVRALAERLARLEAADPTLLGRRASLVARLAHLEALHALGDDERLLDGAWALRRALRLTRAAEETAGLGFYLEQVAALAGDRLRPDPALDLLEGALRRSGLGGHVRRAEGAGRRGVVALVDGRALLVTRVRLAPPTFLVAPCDVEALAGATLGELAAEGAACRLRGPDGATFFAAGDARPEARRRVVPLPPPLAGWRLELDASLAGPAGRALDGQLLVLGALLSASAALLVGSVVFMLRAAGRAIDTARLRSEVLSGVAHDLKTPLSLIRIYAETLRLGRARDAGERDRFLDVILGETDRLHDLIENALRFHRGEGDARRTAHDLAGTVADALRELALPQARAAVELETGPRLPPVAHDPLAIQRVVRNLVTNALGFSPDGGVVTVSLVPDGGGVRLDVRDEGPGIPPDAREHVFEPFTSLRRGGGAGAGRPGSGLGLAVVRQLALAHGGRAWAADRPDGGAGAVVSVWLPGDREDGSRA